jgi:hypothetical protein
LEKEKEIMEGKFNLKYFFLGNGKDSWKKTFGYGWRLVLIGLILFFVWRGITVKQTVIKNVFEEGSNPRLSQGETKKKSWWMPSPFVDIYSFVETDDRKGIGARFGAHWEF